MNFYTDMKNELNRFCEYRTSAGYNPVTQKAILTSFLAFCENSFPRSVVITREMIDGFLSSIQNRSKNTLGTYVSTLRVFTRYLCLLGKESFIPDEDYSFSRSTYIPHIPDSKELKSFFYEVDNYMSTKSTIDAAIMLPVIYRMQYCCGMRPSEPLRLKTSDVSLSSGDIYIRETKNNRDRHIVMSEDMRRICLRYDAIAGKRDLFFQCRDGTAVRREWMTKKFQRYWKSANGCHAKRTRPYDLRHAFATHTIMKWIDEGKDVMAFLPYLSAYMGHAKISCTLYYIHLLPERLRNSPGVNWDLLRKIYGEEFDCEEI